MAKYALIRGGEIVGYRDLDDAGTIAHKVDKEGDGGSYARPVIDPGQPEFNSIIETATKQTFIKKDVVEVVYIVTPRDLTQVKAGLSADIDRKAERERLKYITAGDGQALEYAYVVAEARAFQLDPGGDYPMLAASVAAGEAKTIGDVAALVLAKNTLWVKLGADIRQRRLAAKRGIEAAGNVKDAFDAYSVWGA